MKIESVSSFLWGILSGVVFSLAIWCAVNLTKVKTIQPDNSPYEEYFEKQRDSLNAKIKSLEKDYKTADIEKVALRQRVYVLEQELNRIKKSYEKSVSDIGSFTNVELEREFAKRYPDSTRYQ